VKIKLIHLLTDVNSVREKSSIKSLESINELGINYIQNINEVYSGDDYKIRKPIYLGNHGPGHWGLFQSFKKAIEQEFTEDLDGIIICECDCIISVELEEFVKLINEGLEVCREHLINYISFGPSGSSDGRIVESKVIESHSNYGSFFLTDRIIQTHCIMFPRHSREYLLRQLNSGTWDTLDWWINWAFGECTKIAPNRFGILRKSVAYQHEGMSLIDNLYKNYYNKR
jgi:hypothetical protein